MKPEQFESMAKSKDFETIRKLNPDLFQDRLSKPAPIPNLQSQEDKFYDLWQGLGGDALTREHQFHETRRWRLDFYHTKSRTGIEIDGGVWVKSGHTSGNGLLRDKEKSNECTFMGIHLFRLAPEQITVDNLKRIIEFTKQDNRSSCRCKTGQPPV